MKYIDLKKQGEATAQYLQRQGIMIEKSLLNNNIYYCDEKPKWVVIRLGDLRDLIYLLDGKSRRVTRIINRAYDEWEKVVIVIEANNVRKVTDLFSSESYRQSSFNSMTSKFDLEWKFCRKGEVGAEVLKIIGG